MESDGNKHAMKYRLTKWDNAKACLVILVVLGHFADFYSEENTRVQALFLYIYLFHMPAFIFVTGLFAKNIINADRFKWDKVIPYLYLSILLNYYRVLTQRPWNPNIEFHPMKFGNVSWYLFVVFVYLLITRAIRKLPKPAVLIASIVLACLAGFVESMSEYQVFYRLGLLYPYFWLGYISDPVNTAKKLNGKAIRCGSAIALTVLAMVCLLNTDKLYVYRRLITNANSYAVAGFGDDYLCWVYRLADIALVMIVMSAFFSLIPNKRLAVVSKLGTRTLSVYFWHLGLVEILVHTDWFNNLININNLVLLFVFFVLSIAISLLLSTELFAAPLEWLMKAPSYLPVHMKKT